MRLHRGEWLHNSCLNHPLLLHIRHYIFHECLWYHDGVILHGGHLINNNLIDHSLFRDILDLVFHHSLCVLLILNLPTLLGLHFCACLNDCSLDCPCFWHLDGLLLHDCLIDLRHHRVPLLCLGPHHSAHALLGDGFHHCLLALLNFASVPCFLYTPVHVLGMGVANSVSVSGRRHEGGPWWLAATACT